jgi:hypothetical protein
MSGPLTIREHELWLAGAEAMRKAAVRCLEAEVAEHLATKRKRTSDSEGRMIADMFSDLARKHASLVNELRVTPPEVES